MQAIQAAVVGVGTYGLWTSAFTKTARQYYSRAAVLMPFGWESDRAMQAMPVSVNKTEDTRPAAFKKRASRRGNEAPAKFNRMT
jgi:hypothetical protein